MARTMRTRAAVGLLAVAVLAACGGDPPSTTSASPPGTAAPRTSAGATAPATLTEADRCPVTRPRPWRPPAGVAVDALFGAGFSHGNGKLWVGGLEDDGVIEGGPGVAEPDRSMGIKLGWWREVAGSLRISGRRLDAPAPPLRADVPAGYGDRGFQASGVYFPTEGCWAVTGSVGSTALTFVTLVAWGAGPSTTGVAPGSARPRS